jgi:L,D-transpeptidase YcbB
MARARPSILRQLLLNGLALGLLGPCACTSRQEAPTGVRRASVAPACNDTSVQARLRLRKEVLDYYRGRAFAPRWDNEGTVSPLADTLIQIIDEGRFEGIVPRISASFLRTAAHRRYAEHSDSMAILDLWLTDAFFTHVCERLHGGGCRDSCSGVRADSRGSSAAILDEFAASVRPGMVLRDLSPRHLYYRGLISMRLRIAGLTGTGPWAPLTEGTTVHRGAQGPVVHEIQARLKCWGDLPPWRSPAAVFDSTLAAAVCAFQVRHGIPPTGVLDSATFAALNVSPAGRLTQVDKNLDRWRRRAHDLGDRYVLVNIPDFRLVAVEQKKVRLSMNVVVGLPLWPTPTFSSQLSTVVFNPTWISPGRILAAELVNYIKADSAYLRANAMVILRGEGSGQMIVDPHSIDWAALRPEKIDFQLRQDPGPQNIMGEVKFLAANPFDVFLHDTPYRDDFRKTERLASHGCIRLEQAFDLATYLLRDDNRWTRARMDSVRATRKPLPVFLAKPVPVHVVYATAWLDTAGRMQFRGDPYTLDADPPGLADSRRPVSVPSTARSMTP